MKVTIKDLLNITGVQGYILAGRKNIQVKLPSKFNITSIKEHIPKMYKDLMDEKNEPGNIIEIFTLEIAVIVFCSAMPLLIVVTNNAANIPLIRITGKLVHANLIKEVAE
jgi:hypothetical protein